METWIPRLLQDDGMIPMCEAPSYAKTVTQYVTLADHRQALAEKDKQYQQLMAKAVRFAEGCNVRSDSVGLEALQFLDSSVVQQWRKEYL